MEAQYFFWQAMLDGAQLGIDVHNDGETPQPGFYRTKEGEPVAVWFEDGDSVVMTVRGVEVPPEKLVWYWQRSMTRPVEEDVFRAVEDGGTWPDMDDAVAETLGDNIKDARDAETIAEMLARLEAGATMYATISSDEVGAKAQSLRSRILELSKRADGIRVEEKAPHLKASKAVDDKWQPLVKRADAAGARIRAALGAWEDVKRKAAVEAERLRQAAKEIEERQGLPVSRETQVEIEAPREQVRGGYGRAASVRVRRLVVSIDPLRLFPRYAQDPAVVALLTKLAQADTDAGLTVDGAVVEDRSIVN